MCFGVFQIGGIEAFGEPVVDIGEDCAGLVVACGCVQRLFIARA
jgi:hypothetical protein